MDVFNAKMFLDGRDVHSGQLLEVFPLPRQKMSSLAQK